MSTEIITTPLTLNAFGFSGVSHDGNYVEKAFELMDKMWKIVKSKGIKTKGKNIWVYEPDHKMFAGVELEENESNEWLERKSINLPKYAYYKHVGPYQFIKQSGQNMREELSKRGFQTELPYIEIYGHWTPDETKLETELIMALSK